MQKRREKGKKHKTEEGKRVEAIITVDASVAACAVE